MILSNSALLEYLDRGRIRIDPRPHPPRPDAGEGKCPYQTTAVDLRLGTEIACFKDALAINIDLRRGSFAQLFAANSERKTLSREQPYALNPGKFVLARTFERIELPIADDGACLAARIEGKSSYARCGMLVHFTAPTIHAGFDGTITLELMNLGPIPVLLYPLAPICQLIVERVEGLPFRNDSQFQGQSSAGGAVVG